MIKKAKNEIIYLTVEDFEIIVSSLISTNDEFSEDIPPFNTRYEGRLEGILGQIEANYFGKELYSGLINKAVWLFYCLIKGHPFFNGNKRIAVVALFVFLKRNTSELYINEAALLNGLFQMAIRTAESKPEELEYIKAYLKRKIRAFILQY